MPRSGPIVVLVAALAATCEGGSASPSDPPGRAPTAESTGGTTGHEEEAGHSGTGSSGSDDDDERMTVELLELAYGDDPAQTLDLHLPQPSPGEPIAVVVLAHGGLWQAGDKLALANLCEALVESSRGTIACASINYRLSQALGGVCRGAGVDTYVEQIRDLAAAYALLQSQAGAHDLDPARMYVGGHSAGAHLAHSLNLRWSEFSGACARASCPAPAGAIGFEGIYDIAAWDAYDVEVWSGQFACATRKAFGGAPDSDAPCIDARHRTPCWQIGSPTHLAQHAAALGLAPVGHALLIHSPGDNWVDIAEASSFAAALAAAFADLHVISSTDGSCGNGTHDGVLDDPALARCMITFMDSGGATI